jgi:hypothetical protein
MLRVTVIIAFYTEFKLFNLSVNCHNAITDQAKRWHTDGMLKLDGHPNVDGRSQGGMRSLDLSGQPVHVGGMPERPAQKILDNLGLKSDAFGLHGCVRRFKLGYKEIKIQSSLEPMSLLRKGLGDCGHMQQAASPCDSR